MSIECPTRLLSDLPADEDAFGSHKRVAEAIVKLIHEENGGKAIAISGTWGSGKSTVVNFIKEILEKEASASSRTSAVFIFDAWSHEKDPLRRSFLEQLIDFLSSIAIKWISSDDWKETKDKLRKRLKISETTKFPYLTHGGKLFAIAALLVPIGLALLSTAEKLPSKLLWFAGFLAVSPLIVVSILLASRCICTQKSGKDARNRDKKNKMSDIFSLIISRSETKVRNETIETPDPTFIEFQYVFRRILSEALETDKNRRLLLVIDNLDRIDPQNALSVWTTMRTFFEQDSQGVHPWMSQFWLLVPFDPVALNRLWGTDTDGSDELVAAFKNKTFQITFRVSPPVLSDWKDFFEKQLEIAFPAEHHKDDFHDVFRIFRLKGIPKDRSLTPRDIKLFINKVGSLHRQWDDSIPLLFQALYVLHEDDIKIPEEDLTKEDLLSEPVISILKSKDEIEWQKYLAALHFNVEPGRAMQVLIGRNIEKAFREGSPEEISKFQNMPGFSEVCEIIVEGSWRDWAEKEPESIALAAKALNDIRLDESATWPHIWKHLRYALKRVGKWQNMDKPIGEGLAIILRQCPEAEYSSIAKHILKGIGKIEIIGDEEKQTPELSQSKMWLSSCLQVIAEVHSVGYDDLIRKSFTVPSDAKFFLDVMSYLEEEAENNIPLEYFAPESAQKEQIIAEVTKYCNEGKLTKTYANAISSMVKITSDWPWLEFVTALNQRLQGSNNLHSLEIAGCVEIIIIIAKEGKIPGAKNSLKQLSTHGHLAHHLHQAQTENATEAISLCLYPILDAIPSGNLQGQIGNFQAGINYYNAILKDPEKNTEVVNALTELIIKFQKIENLIQMPGSASNTQKLVSYILKRIAKRNDSHKFITPPLLIKQYGLLYMMLSEETRVDLFNRLFEKADLLSKVQEYEFDPSLSELYLFAFNKSLQQPKSSFKDYLLKEIGSLQKEAWSRELAQEGKLIELMLAMLKSGLTLNFTTNFHDALREYTIKVTKSQLTSSLIQDNWDTLLEAFTDFWKDTFVKNIWDDLISQASKSVEPGLLLYGDTLLHAELSESMSDDVVRRVFPEILNRKNVEELVWLSKALKETSIWMNCSIASQGTFKDRVEKEMREVQNEEDREKLLPVAELIGIDVSKDSDQEGKPEDIEKGSEND